MLNASYSSTPKLIAVHVIYQTFQLTEKNSGFRVSSLFSVPRKSGDTLCYKRVYPASAGTPGLWSPKPGEMETWWQVKGVNVTGNRPFRNACMGKAVL